MVETVQALTRHVPVSPRLPAAAALSALGIVYGDIGTSSLYAFKQAALAGGAPSPEVVLGTVSAIFWSLILVVSLKYAILVMQADNHGEGGILALLALLNVRDAPQRSWRSALLIVGVIGAALLYGDGVITPAISVLSALEGLKVDAPQFGALVVPLTLAVLVGLFLIQKHGTAFVGSIFGPVMLVWFVVIAVLGAGAILRAPGVLAAFSPHHAVRYLVHAGPGVTFAVLGAVFLALTGAEAMYADMGHFGRAPIRLGWFAVVLPALALNYFGQGALLLADARAIENPFYLLAPHWAHYPMVLFATIATIIASQSIISGAYSLTQQSIQLGFLPRMRVLHTASQQRGQIYMPVVNWLLALGTLGAVIMFGSSDALGGAYGIAVSILMAVTTLLAALVALQWGYHPLAVLAANGFFLVIELVFVAANSTKLAEGGWFPLALAFGIAFLMMTWRGGAAILERARSQRRQPEDQFMRNLLTSPPVRLPGTAAVFTAAASGIPLGLAHHLKHNRVLHERMLLVSGLTTDAPRVPLDERLQVVAMDSGFTRVILRYGFMEQPNIIEGLKLLKSLPQFRELDCEHLTYYFRRETIIPGGNLPGMAHWRKALFASMHLNANRTAAYFGVPPGQVVEIGLEMEI
jgi:KUP system potassium uptake protein